MQIIIADDDGRALATYSDVKSTDADSQFQIWAIVNWLVAELTAAANRGVQS